MKLIKKIALVLLSIILGLTILLFVSIPIAAIGNTERMQALANTTIPGAQGGPDVQAYVAQPAGTGPFPVVIMIHEFFGLNESIVDKANGLAQEGYLVVAPDTFRGSTTSWIPLAIYQVINSKSGQVNQDLDSVYAWLETQPTVDPKKIGIAGFCYGGRTSLLYSLHNNKLAATVIFYGSLETDPAVLKNLPAPVLGIFGGADASISTDNVQAFEDALQTAGVAHEISIYEGQPHAFMTSMENIRAGGAQGEAWQQMLNFLEINLKNNSSSRSGKSIGFTAPFDWHYYALLVFEHAFGSANHH